ncbi:trypsin-like peptidase domain-containing protein [Kitasatospora sp. NPDC001664]
MTGAHLGGAHAEDLRRCAVRVEVAGEFRGSGFLAGPGLVMSCAHVVRPGRDDGTGAVLVRHGSEAYAVAPTAVRAEPPLAGDGRFHAFPDLALLTVPGLAGSPAAPLADTEAEPGTWLTALGFSTFTPSPSVEADTLSLQVVGRSGPFVRVQGSVQPGFSGSMLVGADGRVAGVLKGSRSYKQDLGGWYVPLAALTALISSGRGQGLAAPAAAPGSPPTDAELVELLMAFPVTARADGRFDLLEIMGYHLGLPHSFEAEERSGRRDHLHRIVRRCRHHRDWRSALRALYAAMEELAPYDGTLEELRTVIGRAAGSWESR